MSQPKSCQALNCTNYVECLNACPHHPVRCVFVRLHWNGHAKKYCWNHSLGSNIHDLQISPSPRRNEFVNCENDYPYFLTLLASLPHYSRLSYAQPLTAADSHFVVTTLYQLLQHLGKEQFEILFRQTLRPILAQGPTYGQVHLLLQKLRQLIHRPLSDWPGILTYWVKLCRGLASLRHSISVISCIRWGNDESDPLNEVSFKAENGFHRQQLLLFDLRYRSPEKLQTAVKLVQRCTHTYGERKNCIVRLLDDTDYVNDSFLYCLKNYISNSLYSNDWIQMDCSHLYWCAKFFVGDQTEEDEHNIQHIVKKLLAAKPKLRGAAFQAHQAMYIHRCLKTLTPFPINQVLLILSYANVQ